MQKRIIFGGYLGSGKDFGRIIEWGNLGLEVIFREIWRMGIGVLWNLWILGKGNKEDHLGDS